LKKTTTWPLLDEVLVPTAKSGFQSLLKSLIVSVIASPVFGLVHSLPAEGR
jgi:hypothetical protein